MKSMGLKDGIYVPEERSLEARRSRGEVACAECRRLRLKCDRKIPCSSCITRNCTTLCPNASVVTKDTTRTVVAASQHLHDEIANLRNRTRSLESALGTLHYKRMGSVHPLLSHQSKLTDENGEQDADTDKLAKGVAELHLSPAVDGMQRFFGNTQLLRSAPTTVSLGMLAPLPPVLDYCIRLFPFPTPPGTCEQAVTALRAFLPDRTYVEQRLHDAFDNVMFQAPAVEEKMIFNELLPGLYNARLEIPPCALSHQEQGSSPRAFALLYALLAHGVLLESDNPARELHATTLGRLSLAGLGAISIFEKPSYMSVLALFMHSVYQLSRHKELSERGRWLNNLALQTALQMGLYLDPTHWDLPWVTVQRRRRLFWAIYHLNLRDCLTTGRPPAMCDPALIDCDFPFDEASEHDADGPKRAHGTVAFQHTRDVVARVVMLTNVAEPPPYQEILALDATIRAAWVSFSSIRLHLANSFSNVLVRAVMLGPHRASMLISLHRGHFVQAVKDSPEDPIKSRYGVSFQAAAHSAWEILEWMPSFFEADPAKAVHVHPHSWTTVMTAAMVLYTIIEKAPHSDCAPALLSKLEHMRDLFVAAKDLGGGHAASGLPLLQSLCASSRDIIVNRDRRLARMAWNVQPSEALSQTPETGLGEPSSDWPHLAPPNEFDWLDDDVSDSFKSLFRTHYRDAQRATSPSTISTPPTPAILPRLPAVSTSYPGYLQHSSARSIKSSRARESASVSPIRLPELHPVIPQVIAEHTQTLASPADTMVWSPDPGCLTGIWLAHSRQVSAFPPSNNFTSDTGPYND